MKAKISASRSPTVIKKITALENQIRKSKEQLAKLRRKAGEEEVEDYAFIGSAGEELQLSQLFGDKNELIVIHNMGRKCPYCTMWADGFNGVLKHLEDRAAFAVSSPDDWHVQRRFANERGWRFRMVSTKGTTFKKDHGMGTNEKPWPGVSTFRKDESGRIFHHATTKLGPGDNYCIVWDLLDLLPKGDAGWTAKFHYV